MDFHDMRTGQSYNFNLTPAEEIYAKVEEMEKLIENLESIKSDEKVYYNAQTGKFSALDNSAKKGEGSRFSLRRTISNMGRREVTSGSGPISREAAQATILAFENLAKKATDLETKSALLSQDPNVPPDVKAAIRNKLLAMSEKLVNSNINRLLHNQYAREQPDQYAGKQLDQYAKEPLGELPATIKSAHQTWVNAVVHSTVLLREQKAEESKNKTPESTSTTASVEPEPTLSNDSETLSQPLPDAGPPPPPPPPGVADPVGSPPPPPPGGMIAKKPEERLPGEPDAPAANLLELKGLNKKSVNELTTEKGALDKTIAAMKTAIEPHRALLDLRIKLEKDVKDNEIAARGYHEVNTHLVTEQNKIREMVDANRNEPVTISWANKQGVKTIKVYRDAYVDDYNSKAAKANSELPKTAKKIPLIPTELKASNVLKTISALKEENDQNINQYETTIRTKKAEIEKAVDEYEVKLREANKQLPKDNEAIPGRKDLEAFKKLVEAREKKSSDWNLASVRRGQMIDQIKTGKAPKEEEQPKVQEGQLDAVAQFYAQNPEFKSVQQDLAEMPTQTLNAALRNPTEAFRNILSNGDVS